MTDFQPGQPVTVHIGGIDNDPAGHQGTVRLDHVDTDALFVDVDMYDDIVRFKRGWVVPVTPPCPFKPRETFEDSHGFVWRSMWTGEERDELRYFDAEGNVFPGGLTWSDVAARGPFVRLVPEQPARPTLQTGISATLRTWLPIEGTGRYHESCGRDSGTRKQIEQTYGHVTEVAS